MEYCRIGSDWLTGLDWIGFNTESKYILEFYQEIIDHTFHQILHILFRSGWYFILVNFYGIIFTE